MLPLLLPQPFAQRVLGRAWLGLQGREVAPPSLDSVYKNLKFPTVGEWCNCKRLFPVTKRSSKPGVSLQDSGPHFTEAVTAGKQGTAKDRVH